MRRRMAACAYPVQLGSQQAQVVPIDNDDIGGVVTSAKGPEAGVWVIAETSDLPTRFARMVVTDDQGRYVIPDLPKANYDIWVRGYGLVDSPKVKSAPGKILNLKAVVAPNEAAAAQYYPAIYWYSMLKIPDSQRVRRQGRDPGEDDADRMAQHDEEQRLRRLPSARPALHAHVSRRACRIRSASWRRPRKRGSAASSPVNPASKCSTLWSSKWAARRFAISPTGRTASPRASCRTQSRAPARDRAQYRRHDLGLARRKKISA